VRKRPERHRTARFSFRVRHPQIELMIQHSQSGLCPKN
jgi:hypothetical protein